jgi:hypothetical protein
MEPKKSNIRPRQSSLFKSDELEISKFNLVIGQSGQKPEMVRSDSQTSSTSNAKKPTVANNYTPPRMSSMSEKLGAIPSSMSQLPKKIAGNIPKSTSNTEITRGNSNNTNTKNSKKPVSAFQTQAQPQIKTNVTQISSGMSPISTPSSDKQKIMLKDLESKSKPDLIAVAKKLGSEINIKNRLINDGKVDKKWLIAEIGVYKVGNLTAKKYRMSELQKAVSLMATSNLEKNIIESLIVLKSEFDDAKKALEKVFGINFRAKQICWFLKKCERRRKKNLHI